MLAASDRLYNKEYPTLVFTHKKKRGSLYYMEDEVFYNAGGILLSNIIQYVCNFV